ncbi:hypothetical protein HK105_207050 [Polyrhizophydium stewartii]|uniref:EXPERA domain-containing protein n=1 Tax=Polyrhizophydium stewartii TaxID=2732419 RepID=A0ABR4N1P8_9FUNG
MKKIGFCLTTLLMASRGGGRGGGGWRGGRGGGRGGFGGRGGPGPGGLEIPDGLIVTFQETPLYPAFDLPVFKEPTEQENDMYESHTKFLETIRSSPFYLELPVPKDPIERYSDRFKLPTKPLNRPLQKVHNDLAFFPDELHSVKDVSKKIVQKLVNRDIDLRQFDTLELAEAQQSKKDGADTIAVEEGDENAVEEEYEEENEEDDNDYLIDYYEDDLDLVGGDSDATSSRRGRGQNQRARPSERHHHSSIASMPKHVLVAVDDTKTGVDILTWTFENLLSDGDSLTAMSVVSAKDAISAGEPLGKEDMVLTSLQATTRKLVEQTGRKVLLHCNVQAGDPRPLIVDTAIEVQADLVIVGSRGHSAVAKKMTAAASSAVEHPFYPLGLSVPNYNGRTWTALEILSVFFGVIVVAVIAGFVTVSRSAHYAPRRSPPFGTRLVFLWFLACGGIHTFVEGYFATFHRTIAGESNYMAELWKEYALSDSRYMTSDPSVVLIESITAYFWGPLSFVVCYMILKNSPSRHLLQFLISFGQLYGDVLYYGTTLAEGAPHCRPSAYYFWFYFVFMNAFWILIPGLIMFTSGARVVHGLRTAMRAGAARTKTE